MKILLTGLLYVLSIGMSATLAQTIAVTENGDSIHVFSDGTWKPIDNGSGSSVPIFGSVSASKKYDSKTKKVSNTTDSWNYFAIDKQQKAISGSISKIDSVYKINLLYYGDHGCLKKDETVLRIGLTNGKIIECIQSSKNNCSSPQKASFIPLSLAQSKEANYVEMLNENISLLATYDWQVMRIEGSNFTINFTPYQTKKRKVPEQFFRQHLSALNR